VSFLAAEAFGLGDGDALDPDFMKGLMIASIFFITSRLSQPRVPPSARLQHNLCQCPSATGRSEFAGAGANLPIYAAEIC
jgi:hypothetical protein